MKRAFFLLVACALALACLAGCSGSSPLDPRSPVTLTMWHNYGGDMQRSMDVLIDEFNSTVGREQGIVVDVTAISSSSELNSSLDMIANGDPGAPELPDIFTGYPKVATQLQEQGMLANLDGYFDGGRLAGYVDAFVAEGRLGDGGLYVFPIAKSTEVLYVNQTLFDRFAQATGARMEQLATFEGIAGLARLYYDWTDGLTPDVAGDGKQFYTADSWFNVAEVGVAQLGGSMFSQGDLALGTQEHAKVFDVLYEPAAMGGFAIYDGYSSDLSKTGDVVCSTGSSAGILFYGDTITYADGTVEAVDYSVLPYPVFEGGYRVALQRGGGLMVSATTEQREHAACVFIEWLAAPEQNMRFIAQTGYLPVTKQAFEEDMPVHLQGLEDPRIEEMLACVLAMYEEYAFFTAPSYAGFDDQSAAYERDFKAVMAAEHARCAEGGQGSAQRALAELQA